MCAVMPHFFAAMWKRGAAETLSRSRMASAGMPSWTARATRSSGVEEPSRKLKAERACNSIKALVIESLHEPFLRWLAIDAIELVVRQRDIPLVARPGVVRPPITRGTPGAGGCYYVSVNVRGVDADGSRCVAADRCFDRRTKIA